MPSNNSLDSLFPEVSLQGKGVAAPLPPREEVKEPPVWWKRIARHWGHQFMTGAAEQKGSWQDAQTGAALQEPGMLSLARGMGMPREWIDAISPVKLSKLPGADTYGREFQAKETSMPEWESDPSALVEHVGKGLRGAGGALMNPIGSNMKLGTVFATGYGSGAIGDVGRKTGVGLNKIGNQVTGSTANPEEGVLPTALEFIGSLAGGYAGTVKASAIGEGAGMVGSGVKKAGQATGDTFRAVTGETNPAAYKTNVGKAGASAVVQKREGDARSLFDIFTDEYKLFSADQKNFVQQSVAYKLKTALQDDPMLQKNMQDFLEANGIAAKGSKYTPEELAAMFDTAQRTGNPALAALVLERKERTDSLKASARVVKRQEELRNALKGIFGGVKEEAAAGTKNVDTALNEFIGAQQAKDAAIRANIEQVKGEVSNLNADALSMQGKAIKAAYEAEKAVSKGKVDELYANARQLGDSVGPVFKLHDSLKQADRIIGSAPAAMGEGGKVQARRLLDYLTPENKIHFGPDGSIDFTKPLKYSEADDLGKALNAAISDARYAGDGFKVRQLTELKKTLNEQIYRQAAEINPQLAEARQKADAFFANEHAPRFKEGVLLDKEAGRSRPGLDNVRDVDVVSKYIPKTGPVDEATLAKFDDVFGEKYRGAGRREEAYAHMGQYVEDLYRQRVLNSTGPLDIKAHAQFLSDMSPVFKRVPGLEEKISGIANKIVDLQQQQWAIERNTKYLLGREAPVTGVLGQDEAKLLYAKALSDPRRMSQLVQTMEEAGNPGFKKDMLREAFNFAQPVNPDGSLDAERLRKVLYAGRADDGRISGFQTLARAAYGKEKGDEYFKKMESLLTLVERENLTAPRYMRQKGDDLSADPITSLTGQSPQSYISHGYALASGRVNPAYVIATPISRFMAKQLGGKIAEAEEKLLHTPEGVNVLLELRDKGPGQKLSASALETLGAASEGSVDLFHKVFNTGDIGSITTHSALRAADAVMNEEDKAAKQPVPGSVSDAGPGGFAAALAKYDEKYGKPFARDVTPEQEKAQMAMAEGFFGGAGVIKAISKGGLGAIAAKESQTYKQITTHLKDNVDLLDDYGVTPQQVEALEGKLLTGKLDTLTGKEKEVVRGELENLIEIAESNIAANGSDKMQAVADKRLYNKLLKLLGEE